MTISENSQTKNESQKPIVPNWTFTLLPDRLHQPQQVVSHCVKKDEKSSERQHD